MAEEGSLDEMRSQSATPPAAPLSTQPSEIQEQPDNAQAAPPRTIGGFVDEDDDDDAEEEDPQSSSMSASSEYDPNIDGGPPATSQQDPPAYTATAALPLSPAQPDSSMTFVSPPETLDNSGQDDQSMADSPPVNQEATSNVPVTNGLTIDPVSSIASSHTVTAGRASINPDSVDAPPTVPRPITANGIGNSQSPTTAAPPARLPSDRVGILEDRIREDPKGDTDAWLSLIVEYRARGKVAEVRKTYDDFLATFPTNADQWTKYVNFELEEDRFNDGEAILNRCISKITNLGLWKTYLNYVRRRHPLMGPAAENSRKTVGSVFDYVLEGVGIDKDAGSLWREYIDFLKSGPGVLGGSDWQDKQKADTVRKAYQTAIGIPTDAVENLWKEYDKFEMELNKMVGRKNLQEKSADYMTARSFKTNLQNLTRVLNRSTTPVLPPMYGCEGYAEYMHQIELWKKWIELEKDDTLVLKEDQPKVFEKRVLYVYKQATMSLRFWPEMWFDAAQYCFETGQTQQGDEFIDQGFQANPESCLLAFKKAERVETTTTNGDTEESILERGGKVRAPYDTCLEALYGLINKNTTREQAAVALVEEKFARQNYGHSSVIQSTEQNDDEQDDSQPTKVQTEMQAQIASVRKGSKGQEDLCKKLITSAWIALMRAMRRIQGKGSPNQKVGGMRKIFVDARKRGRLNSDFYVASALLEHHCYKDLTAIKIFDRGFKMFPEDEHFAIEYIKHLININDSTNVRVIFETIVNKLTQKVDDKMSEEEREARKQRAKPIFAVLHNYESLYGELEQIKKLEKRMSTLYPEDPQLVLFAQRYTEASFDPCAVRPVISPQTQARARISSLIDQITQQTPSPQDSPRLGFAHMVNGGDSNTRSPKRPLEDSDNEGPARKVARGESPLKGAAGRRLDAVRRTAIKNEATPQQSHAPLPPAPPPLIPRPVYQLLSSLPPARTYEATLFDPQRMADLLRGVDFSRVNINAITQSWNQPQQPQQPQPPPVPYQQPPNPQMFFQQHQPPPQPNYGQPPFYGHPSAYGYTR